MLEMKDRVEGLRGLIDTYCDSMPYIVAKFDFAKVVFVLKKKSFHKYKFPNILDKSCDLVGVTI